MPDRFLSLPPWHRLAWAAVLLAGCAASEPPAAPPAVTPPPEPPPPQVEYVLVPPTPSALAEAEGTVTGVLEYADRLRGLTGGEVAQEIVRLQAAPPSPPAQVELALALIQTRVGADAQRAAQMLQRVLAQDSAQARSLHPLVRLLLALQGEQRRVEEQADRATQQLRDAHRRLDLLNERLDALRAIERARPPRSP